MRNNLALTIFAATAAVVSAVVFLASDSTWTVLAGAVVGLLSAATLVVGVALRLADDGDNTAPKASTGARS
jgi:hypothetical protein